MIIVAMFHNPETDEDVEFDELDFDDCEIIEPWLRDQFHDLEGNLVIQHRHLGALGTFLIRTTEDPETSMKFTGCIDSFRTVARFIIGNLGWQVHITVEP